MKAFFKALGSGLGWLALYLLPQFFVIFIYVMALGFGSVFDTLSRPGVSPGDITDIANELIARLLDRIMTLTLVSVLLSLALIVVILLARRRQPLKRQLVLFKPGRGELPPLIGLAVGLSLIITGALNLLPLPDAALEEYLEHMDISFANAGNVLSYLVYAVVVAPVAEEAVFRGLIYTNFRRGMPAVVAVILASLLFGLMHGNLIQMIYAFALGAVFNLVLIRYRSLWPCIAMHITVNLSSLVCAALLGFSDGPVVPVICLAAGLIISAVTIPRARATAPVFSDMRPRAPAGITGDGGAGL